MLKSLVSRIQAASDRLRANGATIAIDEDSISIFTHASGHRNFIDLSSAYMPECYRIFHGISGWSEKDEAIYDVDEALTFILREQERQRLATSQQIDSPGD